METKLTKDNFEKEVIKSKLPVFIDFWAPWCGPCQIVTPHIADLAKKYKGKLKVCKLNIDDAPKIAARYTIMSIPAFMIFKEGKIMEKRVGVMGKNELEKLVSPHL